MNTRISVEGEMTKLSHRLSRAEAERLIGEYKEAKLQPTDLLLLINKSYTYKDFKLGITKENSKALWIAKCLTEDEADLDGYIDDVIYGDVILTDRRPR